MKPQKSMLTALLLFLVLTAIAQQGINYKALIKDSSGNVLASSPISIQFIIYEGVSLTNNVYQESHTVNTDANGIVIVNIGQGITSDVFANINWGIDQHFLNVQVNIGSGFVDMGTTEFMTVPYALSAANVSGLEKITEGINTGWRLIGQDPTEHGDIGSNALDLSIGLSTSNIVGAKGQNSIAIGIRTSASGTFSTAIGVGTIASGFKSTAIGNLTKAEALSSTAIGTYNIGGGNPTTWSATDPLFEIGNSQFGAPRSNALTVLKNGNVGIATPNPTVKLQINGNTDASLSNGSGLFVTGNETGLNIVFDDNEIMARNNGIISPLYLQNDGGNLIINNANNGNVGIGNSAPSSKLDVSGVIRARNNTWPTTGRGLELAYDANWGGSLDIGAGYIQAYSRDNAAFEVLFVGASEFDPVSDNFTRLGSSANRWKAVYAVNGTIQTSDRRLKKDINNITYGLNTVMKLRPVSYKWKQGNQDLNLGLIAQEVQKLIPEVIDVGNDKDKTLGMKYTELIPVLIKAIQEQQKIIEQQKNKNQQLSAELTTQNKNIENLVKRMNVLEANNQ